MYVLLDTCFISHSKELLEENILDIRNILLKFRLTTTDLVKEEILHYDLDSFLGIDNVMIIPNSQEELKKYQSEYKFLKEMDKEDQTLWIAANKTKNEHPLVLTDDGGLKINCQISGIRVMYLPSFILSLVKMDVVSKNQANACFRFWRDNGKYAKSKLDKWMKELTLIE